MIEYRKAHVDDCEALVELRIRFLKEAQGIDTDENDLDIKDALSRYFTEKMGNGGFIAWLALDECKIVATSGLCFYTLPPSFTDFTGKVAYIMNMYTEPSYRKQGIATNLFGRLLDEAKALGYKKVCLNTTAQGRPIYERFGFRETGDEMALRT
jgi:GNAT superfamily N-acetyltransferase